MKSIKQKLQQGLAIATLVLAGATQSQAQMLITNVIQTFDANDTSGNKWGHEWGSGTQAWDGTQGNPVGALLVTADFSNSSDTPCTTYVTQNGNPWYVGTALNFSTYSALEFDIKWDTTSDITLDEFNNVANIPLTATNSAGATILNAVLNAGSTGGLDIDLCGGPLGQMNPLIINTNIPAAAANGWAHVKIPINKTQAGIDGVSGIVFHKWVNQYSGQITNDFQGRFWVDNVMLTGTAVPPPPPTVKVPVKATHGLNVFASTSGLYDRQSAVLRQNSGMSWVGMATAANPVTYSFTIAGYPTSQNCEAYLFLIPNPNYLDNAPDWNETNCLVVYAQGGPNNATLHFQYKVNEGNNNQMYSGGGSYTNAPGSWDGVTANYLESGNLASVTNNGILGTWTVKFTSDTNVTLIAPSGNSTNFIFPAYNVGHFAEAAVPGFYTYLGMQANNADAQNQAVVYANFAISNSVTPFYENFLTDTVLDTTNVWNTGPATGPQGVLIVPPGAASWVSWTLPDSGFGLQVAPTLTNPLGWTTPSTGPLVPLNALRSQLVASNEIPAGPMAFFRLIKRQLSQIQVLLPGETNAPNTISGKTGTPTAVTAGTLVDVTVNAVDNTWHIIPGVGDIIHIATPTDPASITPVDAPLANGTGVFQVQLNTAGSQTVTATDTTSTNLPMATSSAITVQ